MVVKMVLIYPFAMQLVEAYSTLSDPERRDLFDWLFDSTRLSSQWRKSPQSTAPQNRSEQKKYECVFTKIFNASGYYEKFYTSEPGEECFNVLKTDFSDCFDEDYENYELEIFSNKLESLITELKVDNRSKIFEAKKVVRRQEMKLQQLRNEEENAKQELAIRKSRFGRLFRSKLTEEKLAAYQDASYERIYEIRHRRRFLRSATEALDRLEDMPSILEESINKIRATRRFLCFQQRKADAERNNRDREQCMGHRPV
jgi:curved DNA-binding protein CbpA